MSTLLKTVFTIQIESQWPSEGLLPETGKTATRLDSANTLYSSRAIFCVGSSSSVGEGDLQLFILKLTVNIILILMFTLPHTHISPHTAVHSLKHEHFLILCFL